MMNKKYKYSKTAKERKQEQQQKKGIYKKQETTDEVNSEQSANSKGFFAKKSTRIAAIIIMAVAALSLIAVPIILLTVPQTFDTDVPVAEIRLDNKMTLYFKLDYVAAPNAVNNFIFLAQEGFFENTIIFDTQSNYVKIGGYTDFEPIKHKIDLQEKDPRLPSNLALKYGYTVKDDVRSDASEVFKQAGTLSTLKYGTGTNTARTEFQICTEHDRTSEVWNNAESKTVQLNGVPFGYAYDGQTMLNLTALTQIATRGQGEADKVWQPYVKSKTVKIKKVKIHLKQSNEQKWKKWNFYEEMKDQFSSYTYSDASYVPK